MGFGEFSFSTQMRDTIEQIATNVVNKIRPPYRYGVVTSIDFVGRKCGVKLNGDDSPVDIPVGTIFPSAINQVVRVSGNGTDRFIDDVIGENRVFAMGNSDDFNSYTRNGDFSFLGGAQANCPYPGNGNLNVKVSPDGGRIFQTATFATYGQFGLGTIVFTRAYATAWSPWRSDRPIMFDANATLVDVVNRIKPTRANPAQFWYCDAATSVPIPRGTVDGVVYYDQPGGNIVASYAWVSPALQGSWAEYGGGYTQHRAIKTSTGIVLLRGLVKGGAAGSLIFTLPAGMRPAQRGLYPTIGSGGGVDALALVRVETNGDVYFAAGQSPSGWLSLAGVTFPSSDVAPNAAWTNCSYQNGFAAYGDVTYGNGAQYWKDALGTVWFRGLTTRAAGAPTADTLMFYYGAAADGPPAMVHIPGGGGGGFMSNHIAGNGLYWKTGSASSMTYLSHCGQFVVPNGVGSWATYTLANSWVNYGSSFPVAQVWRRPDGLLVNRGLIDVGSGGTIPGVPVPASMIGPGYRESAATDLMTVNSNNAWGRIDYSSGGMGVQNGSGIWVSLDGMLGFVEG